MLLQALLPLEQFHHKGCWLNQAHLTILGCGKLIAVVSALQLAQLSADRDRTAGEIDVIPAQSKHFPLPHTGEKS